MDAEQREQFRQVCGKIDRIGSARQFKCTMQLLAYDYNKKIINAARKFKKCHTAAQYETTQEAAKAAQEVPEAAADVEPQPIALAYTDDLGVAWCGECGAELLCSETGDMPDVCPECGRRLEYDSFMEPDGPDTDKYRTSSQQEAGTAAEAASEGQETALGTPDNMAGTDATEAAGGKQPPPQAGEINLGKLIATLRPKAGGGLRVLKPEPP